MVLSVLFGWLVGLGMARFDDGGSCGTRKRRGTEFSFSSLTECLCRESKYTAPGGGRRAECVAVHSLSLEAGALREREVILMRAF